MGNQVTQNFQAALDYEKSCQSRADLFYNKRYPGQTIFRPTWENDKSLQQLDIDVCMRWTGQDGWPMELKISEKFRTQPWPDICIEIYEDIDNKRPGWGKKTAADWHFFFHEHKWTQTKWVDIGEGKQEAVEEPRDNSYVRMVPTWAIRKMWAFCADIFTDAFDDMKSYKVNSKETIIKDATVRLLLVPTKVNGKTAYTGACACVPMELFKSILNCEIEEQLY